MGRTTRRTQSASHKPVSRIQPNQAAGKQTPAPPANAFQGRPERVPQLVYIADFANDGFLGEALGFYAFFGLEVKKVKSIHEMVIDLGKREGVFERLCLVSHAHPLGMYLPMFTGAAKGTNKELFKELAKSDLDGLLTLSPFDPRLKNHVKDWAASPRIDRAMKGARTKDTAGVLKLFGLEKSGSTPPAGDLSEFFFHCFDIVFTKATDPKALTVKGAPLANAERQTLRTFVGEVLNQLTRKLDGTSISGHKVKKDELDALRATVTSMAFDDLGLPPGERFDLDLDDTTLNSFASQRAIVKAIQGGFRKQLDDARSRMSDTTLFDIRGCRAAQDPEYVTSVSEFLGKPGGAHPTVTAPRLFQSYKEIMFDTVHDRASIRTWLGNEQRQHSPKQLRDNLTTWADLIRVHPLHTDFWRGLFGGPAVRFAAMTWPADIPKLFIPTPGLEKLPTTDIGQMIAKVTNFFNVPKTSGSERRNAEGNQGGRFIGEQRRPDVAGVREGADCRRSPQAAVRRPEGDQRGRGPDARSRGASEPAARGRHPGVFRKHCSTTSTQSRSPRLKTFMTAAAENLKEDGDGLFYYLFFAGLPGFIFGRPEIAEELHRGLHAVR